MILNPYKVLGVPQGSSLDDCTKAYKKLAKKYHPDLNPDNKAAEEKMAEINAAYDQIKNGDTQSPFASSSPYERANTSSSSSTPDYYASVTNFIMSRQYTQALNLLRQMDDDSAKWHYLSSLAHMGLGNQKNAQSHIDIACRKEPGNQKYQSAKNSIMQGINPTTIGFDPFSFVRNSYTNTNRNNNQNTRQTVYTVRRRGCLSRFLRFLFIIFIFRLVIYLIMGLSSGFTQNKQRTTSPNEHYTQDYQDDYHDDYYDDYQDDYQNGNNHSEAHSYGNPFGNSNQNSENT